MSGHLPTPEANADFARLPREERYALMANRHRLRPSRAAASRLYADLQDLGVPLDHTRAWRDEDDMLVLTSEPYGIWGRGAEGIGRAVQLGWRIEVDGISPWNPGATVLIVARPPAREARS